MFLPAVKKRINVFFISNHVCLYLNTLHSGVNDHRKIRSIFLITYYQKVQSIITFLLLQIRIRFVRRRSNPTHEQTRTWWKLGSISTHTVQPESSKFPSVFFWPGIQNMGWLKLIGTPSVDTNFTLIWMYLALLFIMSIIAV